ncbi:glutamate-rich WD repeat-containing protein 1-like [Centruroides sculpturatus]|uniref:glutamate-rich WD repeat-containing protein 1-like n=1 Tax=Centruroides sculpturatus TaxID=218467 RepID=UPI000C6D764F|nr:glutamate-rich WD repeat-containing protein 1-like [Centruroides sculpturatus]XP_023209758.1 glutamate-rich WD repeat-containing protein 1-like [Centruroides sculpturatus]
MEDDEIVMSSGDESEEMGNEDGNCNLNNELETYLPGKTVDDDDDLEYDETAYVLYHHAQTGAPCLSFDIIKDSLGDNRADAFPLTAYLAAGTQAQRLHTNNVIVMKMSNLHRIKIKKNTLEDESDSESDEECEDDKPELECAMIPHQGCVNRIRVTSIGETPIAASWSETGKVFIWNLSHPLTAVNNHIAMTSYVRNRESPKPIFTFPGHQSEGFAMDWSSVKPGVLATGDCNKNIHLWKPLEGGQWHVDQRAYSAHSQSVEDLQWSPNEANVLASCSVDRSIRIWDMRSNPSEACILTTENAHDNDVNVISWNRLEPFILSGGDDGAIKVWDLRQFQVFAKY